MTNKRRLNDQEISNNGLTSNNKKLKQLSPTSSTIKNSKKLSQTSNNSISILNKRLKKYNLDYVEDLSEHLKEIYNPNSKWFSRSVKLKFDPKDHLPYRVESHTDRARYLCHVVLNLYIAISSLDIQGLISISDKDIENLKAGINEFIDETQSNNSFENNKKDEDSTIVIDKDIANFDEGEDEEDQFDENEYIEFTGPDFNAVGKITSESKIIINVNHWTNELKSCLDFNFPLSLRKSLVIVYYNLSMVQGQKIYRQLHVDVLETLIDSNSNSTNFTELLKKDGLVLEHESLFQFLCEFLPYPDSDYVRYDIASKDDLNLFRLLLKLAHMSKVFFDEKNPDILPNIMNILSSSIAPSTLPVVLPIITSFVPYHYNKSATSITDYLPFCFSIWSSASANIAIDTHMYDFVGNVLEDSHQKILKNKLFDVKYNQYGLFTEEQMIFLFNRLQGHLRTNGQIHSYSRTVRPFIYSINGDSNEFFFENLSNLATSIETFVHPSNSGFWTKPIAKFVHSFIKMYHGRVKKEEILIKQNGASNPIILTSLCHSKIMDIFLNILFIGAQNKNPDIANFYISCFGYLVDLNASKATDVLDRILTELYDSLSDEYINSRHRIIASLKQFSRVARYMVMDKLYRVHITNILYMLTVKLDMNDINLSSNLINGIVSIATFVPFESPVREDEYINFESNTLPFVEQHFYHLKSKKPSNTFNYDQDVMEVAFRASTTVFETVLRTYIDKIFKLADVELEDGFVTKLNQTTMILIQAMDDNLFQKFSEQFLKQFWDIDSFNENNPNFEILTACLTVIVKRNKSISKDIFNTLVINIKNQVERGAGSIRSNTEIQKRDLKLVLYLTALNDVLRQSHESILSFADELIDNMDYIFENITNPPLDVITSILVHSACSSLTTTEIIESHLFSETAILSLDEKWGGLQFDERKYDSNNLNFKWHVPSEKEVELTINIFSKITNKCMRKVEELLENPNPDTNYNDKIQKYILIITHALSGSSLLFDPDYAKLTSKNYANTLKNDLNVSSASSRSPSVSPSVFDKLDDENNDIGPNLNTLETELDVNFSPNLSSTQIVVEDDINREDSMSEFPSRINTPATYYEEDNSNIEEDETIIDHQSISDIPTKILGTIDPTFKDLDIFSYNYFFGNIASDKLSNPLYHQINEERLNIGAFYHKVFKYLSSNYKANINIYQALLHGLKVWFTDVGQETIFNDDPNTNLDYDFLENIQSLSHLEEPFTRTLLSIKANNLHQSRVLLHSTIRFPSALESKLLKDVVHLSCSIYPDIHKPAQGCLLHSMKQIIGSYSTVISSLLKLLKQSMIEQQHMQIEVILRVLCLKKIQRKLLSDFSHLEKIILLLLDCYKINELDISVFSERILLELIMGIKIPSSICVYDSKIFTPLDPVDSAINHRVELIRTAKEKKQKYYLSLLINVQNRLVDILKNSHERNWKIPTFIIRFISKLQSSLEIQTTEVSIETIFNQTKEKHPEMIHLVVRSFLAIFNKVFSLSDYQYNISRAYQSTYDPPFVFELETSSKEGFQKSFKSEMNNFDHPTYFIDGRAYVGWLCWGKPIKVLQASSIDIKLHENETNIVNCLGKLISTDWLADVTKCLIQDNETRSVFSSGDVSFFVLLIILITNKYTENLKLEDLFILCEKYYDRYDKASMIMSIELFAGLICGSKYMNDEEKSLRDKFVDKFLNDCLNNELNQDAFEIWGTLSWWLPSVVDIRRCPPFYKNFTKIKTLMDKTSDEVGNQASKILMLGSIFIGMGFSSPNIDFILDNLVFDHPYDQVRESIGRLMSIITQNKSTPSYKSSTELMSVEGTDFNGLGVVMRPVPKQIDSLIIKQFEMIDSEFKNISSLTPQEIMKTPYYYLSSTMYHWLQDLIRSANKIILAPYIVKYIIPYLLRLMKEKDVCKLGGMDPTTDFLAVAYLPMRKDQIQDIIDLFCTDFEQSKSTNTSYELKLKLAFLQHFISSELLQISESQRKTIFEFIVQQVYNPLFVEVRIRAADVLSDIVHNVKDSDELKKLVRRFSSNLDNFTWEEKKLLSKTDIKIHGSIIALGAIISAFPYIFPLPRWIPEELSKLASWARTSGLAGRSAKDTISEFKKVRADTWNFDRTEFTTDELEDLEGVLWRSYYA